MRDMKYWKKELREMHPSEYIDLLEAIQEHQYMLRAERIRTGEKNE